MEWNTARSGSSLITLYSAGWSEVPDHYQKLQSGLVFDIESLGSDADHTPGMWRMFGGDGRDIDRHIATIRGIPELKTLIKELLSNYVQALEESPMQLHNAKPLVVAFVCAWGKHRSRHVAADIAAWLKWTFPRLANICSLHHLSDYRRRHEKTRELAREQSGLAHLGRH